MKKKFADPREYAMQLSDKLQETETTGTNVAPYFEKLKAAIEAGTVADMPKVEFAEISAEFDDVVEVYAAVADTLDQMKAPVRLIGLHGAMQKTFRQYYEATKVMAGALNITDQTIDEAAFNQSEIDQDNLMEEFMKEARRAFQTVM